jgi:hypothetical protein
VFGPSLLCPRIGAVLGGVFCHSLLQEVAFLRNALVASNAIAAIKLLVSCPLGLRFAPHPSSG